MGIEDYEKPFPDTLYFKFVHEEVDGMVITHGLIPTTSDDPQAVEYVRSDKLLEYL